MADKKQNKAYVMKEHGDGHRPHVMVNPDDSTDQIFLCSCGGTADSDGNCDGTHKVKMHGDCNCLYCQTHPQRVQSKSQDA